MTLTPAIAAAVAALAVLWLGLRRPAGGESSVSEDVRGMPRGELELAGLDSERARRRYRAAAMLGPVVLGCLSAGMVQEPGTTKLATCLMASLGAGVGWWLPRAWLSARRERRRVEIVSDFPVMLDLLQISLQGGMGLPAAWTTVTEGLRGVNEGLAREMRRVDIESGFGVGWSASLEAASDRTGVAEFRSLGSLLGQTQRFGTELSRMVQVMSDSLRHEELQALEERAHRSSVRMLLPLAGLVLPPTILLVAGPLFLLLLDGLRMATPD